MENVIKKLRLEFCLIFIWAAVLIGLFEWDVWTAGWAIFQYASGSPSKASSITSSLKPAIS